MQKHRQIEVKIFDLKGKKEKIKVDKGIAQLIFYLNNIYNLHTVYSCQGDKENPGYIKFEEDTDMRMAIDVMNQCMPKAVCILDFDNVIRFCKNKNAWDNYYDFLKYVQKMRVLATKKHKQISI